MCSVNTPDIVQKRLLRVEEKLEISNKRCAELEKYFGTDKSQLIIKISALNNSVAALKRENENLIYEKTKLGEIIDSERKICANKIAAAQLSFTQESFDEAQDDRVKKLENKVLKVEASKASKLASVVAYGTHKLEQSTVWKQMREQNAAYKCIEQSCDKFVTGNLFRLVSPVKESLISINKIKHLFIRKLILSMN